MKATIPGSKNTGLAVAASLFLLAAVMQVLRLITNFSVAVNGVEVPLSVNIIALAVFLALSYWLLTLRAEQ